MSSCRNEAAVGSRWLDGATYVTVSADLAVQWFTEITGWAPTSENLRFNAEQGLFTVQISYDNPPPPTVAERR